MRTGCPHKIIIIVITDLIDNLDFTIMASAIQSRGAYELHFDINTTRSCFNVTAVDDTDPETPIRTVEFRIDGIRTPNLIQVSPSSQIARVAILDDDCESD